MQLAAAHTAARHATAVAVAVTAGHFINDAYGAMLTPLTPALQSRFGVSIAAVTLLSSVYSLTSSVLQPLLGILGERFDRRYAAALGPLLTGLGLTMLGFVPWFGALVLLVAASGFGSGFFHPAGAAYVALNSPPQQRGLWAMAVLRSLASMGYNAMLPFILLSRGFGAREVGVTLSVYAVASAVGGIVGGRASDRYGRVPVLRAAILSTIPFFALLILSSPANWWFYPLTFLVGAAVNASIPVGVVAAQEYAPGHVAVASSIMMGFSWGFAGLLVFLVGVLADVTSPTVAALASLTLLLPSALIAYRLPEPRRTEFE